MSSSVEGSSGVFNKEGILLTCFTKILLTVLRLWHGAWARAGWQGWEEGASVRMYSESRIDGTWWQREQVGDDSTDVYPEGTG